MPTLRQAHPSAARAGIRARFFLALLLIFISAIALFSAPGGSNPGGSTPDKLALYGYNTHLYTIPSLYNPPPNLDLTTFKRIIDELTGKVRWIRFALWDWEAFPRTDTTTKNIDCGAVPVNCRPSSLQVLDDAINYARSKGFKIHLVTNVPSWAKVYSPPENPWETSYTEQDYRAITLDYYSILAARYAGKVQVWSVFNEANVHNFDRWDLVPTLDSTYLTLLSHIIGDARFEIKFYDALAWVTTPVGGWPYTQLLQDQWKQYYDALYPNLDLLSMNIYPDKDQTIIDALQTRVQEMKTRYSPLAVEVSETGMCTDKNADPVNGRFTEADQATYVPTYVSKLKRASPYVIIPYEYEDNSLAAPPCESTFGIEYSNGAHKSSYDAVMKSLR